MQCKQSNWCMHSKSSVKLCQFWKPQGCMAAMLAIPASSKKQVIIGWASWES